MAASQDKELIYEPMKVHDKNVVKSYNDFMVRYEFDLLSINDDKELARVENQLLDFIVEEPDYLEPIMNLLEIYEITLEQQKCDKLLDHAYKAALRHITDKEGNWYEIIEWRWLENRSIIRALQVGAFKRWKQGKTKEAKKVFQHLLKANPNDNSGVRYYLLALLEGMSVKEFEKKMGISDFLPPATLTWFSKNVKSHPEFADFLRKWGDE